MRRRIALLFSLIPLLVLGQPVSGQQAERVIFLAGRPSHGYGSHEHLAGCRILADAIQRSANQKVACEVFSNGWPEDDSVLDGASTIVMYCDGGSGHPALGHLEKLGQLIKQGVGFVCLHYAVEVPTNKGGAEFLEWLGGYFETHWSVNPHWIAEYQSLPEHTVTRGVKPFQANDEWYFHMRFRPEMDGVTPILSAVAPEHTMLRPDGPHSGNPAVRKEVAEGVPQHTAWVFQRPDGGRSFGFTGGHFHWNWGREDILRLVCNAIVWTAKVDVPSGGLPVLGPSVERLEQGQDEPIPKNHQREKVQQEFQLLSRPADDAPAGDAPADKVPADSTSNNSQQLQHDPSSVMSSLKVREGLTATLAASEPMIRSLTNLDVDHRGRVWVCEVVNYRAHLGKRPEGDRILILEDEDADGVMDTSKVFYQGNDIDSAMGICVLGTRTIVSASPNLWIFTDEDGDDVPEKKELLFSNTGQPQHDHSAHSFVFGPDGKLYWNFGNTGKSVHDASGTLVTDRAGNQVIDNGKPYYGGMVFRCNFDGSDFETVAHNFRNNYEVAVDAFGTLWQSDNDDDGNKAARINFVMEFGNYGYRDEVTGASWQASRANMETTVPQQHWHLNDPGVVPTMLLTGSGSPSAITVYEGSLLPETYRNQIIHCESGHSVVRAYPTSPQGAGYQATVENLLEAAGGAWFRPVDVCSAPDGSLFVTDWYDPGVGGHAMGDLTRGRLFRLSPPNTKYQVPELDVSTPDRAVAALTSSNQSVRFLAWQAVQQFGQSALAALVQLSRDENPRHRARALWALGKISGRGESTVAAALSDKDPDVRCMGIRLARQVNLNPDAYFSRVQSDASPSVRRELAIALRLDKSTSMPKHWAALAAYYEGGDRWLLEALGIGAELRWDECFRAYIELTAQHGKQPHLDLVWRARAAEAANYLGQHLARKDLPSSDAARLLRALDYHPEESRKAVAAQSLAAVLGRRELNPSERSTVVELLLICPEAQGELAVAQVQQVQKILSDELATGSRRRKLDILATLNVTQAREQLVELASSQPVDSIATGAAEKILQDSKPSETLELLRELDEDRKLGLVSALAAGSARLVRSHLMQVLSDESLSGPVRSEAARGLVRTPIGCKHLLELAQSGSLPAECRLMVGSLLRGNSDQQVREKAAHLFPAPKSKSAQELPSLDDLVKLKGDVAKGAEIYHTTGTCAKCHSPNIDPSTDGRLVEVKRPIGPDLSEVGSKLAKEALYVAILDPSAGISHSFESHSALTEEGQILTGLMVSQTDEVVVLRDAEGIDHSLKKAELESISKVETSLMPANLVEQLSVEDLVNLVEFLQTLRKKI